MKRIESTDEHFHDGDPSTGELGTIVTAAWLNAVQEEIANVIEGAGLNLDGSKQTQLLSALYASFQQFGLGTTELPLIADFHDPDLPAGFYQWNQDSRNAPKSFDPGTTGGGGAVKSIRGGDAAGWWAFLSAGGATEAEFFIANTGSHSIGWGPWREVSHSGMFEAQIAGNRGFQKLPKAPGQSRGLVVQFGTATSLTTGDLVGFLIPFPTECITVVDSTRLVIGSSQQTMAAVDPATVTRTGFRTVGATVSGSGSTFNLYYIAIGR